MKLPTRVITPSGDRARARPDQLKAVAALVDPAHAPPGARAATVLCARRGYGKTWVALVAAATIMAQRKEDFEEAAMAPVAAGMAGDVCLPPRRELRRAALLVVPTRLTAQWLRAARTHLPTLRRHFGTTQLRAERLAENGEPADWDGLLLVLTKGQYLCLARTCPHAAYAFVVFDEAAEQTDAEGFAPWAWRTVALGADRRALREALGGAGPKSCLRALLRPGFDRRDAMKDVGLLSLEEQLPPLQEETLAVRLLQKGAAAFAPAYALPAARLGPDEASAALDAALAALGPAAAQCNGRLRLEEAYAELRAGTYCCPMCYQDTSSAWLNGCCLAGSCAACRDAWAAAGRGSCHACRAVGAPGLHVRGRDAEPKDRVHASPAHAVAAALLDSLADCARVVVFGQGLGEAGQFAEGTLPALRDLVARGAQRGAAPMEVLAPEEAGSNPARESLPAFLGTADWVPKTLVYQGRDASRFAGVDLAGADAVVLAGEVKNEQALLDAVRRPLGSGRCVRVLRLRFEGEQ
jgi:hypothetical protein